MTVRVTVTCDGPQCTNAMPILGGLRDASADGIEARGWIVQVAPERSTLTGHTYEAIRQFCDEPCRNAYNTRRRETDARELVRR